MSKHRWSWLLGCAIACSGERARLGDADQVRLDAVVQVVGGRAAVCLAVDPRSGTSPEAAADADGADQAHDPQGDLWAAVSRIGHVYPESRCSRWSGRDGLEVMHPEHGERPGVFVSLGAVAMAADGSRAHLRVHVWPGELLGEVRLLRYRKADGVWSLDSSTLLMQE